MIQSEHKAIRIWFFCVSVYVFLLVGIGGITRLTRSGLSITHWNPVTGILPPLTPEAWQKSFDAYKRTPEYKKVNSHFTLNDYKQIYFWEFVHRLLARGAGLVLLLPYLFFLRRKQISRREHKRVFILFGMGLFQGVLGWVMVQSGMVDNPVVSHYRLAAHLLSAFAIGMAAFWFALSPTENAWLKFKSELTSLALIVLQIFYGALTAGLKAGYLYGTWPKMGSHWIPPEVSSGGSITHNLFENPVAVQWIHRTLAWIVAASIGFSIYRAIRQKQLLNKIPAYAVIGLLALQIVLGILTLIMHMPISLAVAHQMNAYALLMSFLYFMVKKKGTV